MDLEFRGEVWSWRGPSPYHFVTVPDDESAELQATSALVTYGWGMIPVEVRIGSTRWTTSLFPVLGEPAEADLERSQWRDPDRS